MHLLTYCWDSQALLSTCCVPGTKNTGGQHRCRPPRQRRDLGLWRLQGRFREGKCEEAGQGVRPPLVGHPVPLRETCRGWSKGTKQG